MNTNNKISIPGEYKINSLKLTSYNGFEVDLTPNLLELTIHESVYQNFISGEILIGENVDLKRHVPLVGNEILEVSFKTSSYSNNIKHKFYIYKVSPSINFNSTNKANAYHLHFVSMGGFNTQIQKFSRSFSNMKYSEMVSSIFLDNHIDDEKYLTCIPTSSKKHFVFPFMSSIEAINMLSSRSISEDLQYYSYVFYETLDEYRFAPINYKQNISTTYTQFPPNLTRQDGIFREMNSEMRRIHSISIQNHIDTIDNIGSGVYSSKLITYDTTLKQIKETDFVYTDYLNLKKINDYGIAPNLNSLNISNMNRIIKTKHAYCYDNIRDSEEYENYILKRKSHLNHFNNNKVSIVVSGDSNRRAGDLVNVNILAGDAKLHVTDNPFDYYMSGKYLISKITHMIQNEKYIMRLDLERDSLPKSLPIKKV